MKSAKAVFEKIKVLANVDTYEELAQILDIPHANSISRYIAQDGLPWEKIIKVAIEKGWSLDYIFGISERQFCGIPQELACKLAKIYHDEPRTVTKFLCLATDERFVNTTIGRSLKAMRMAFYRIAIEAYDTYLWKHKRKAIHNDYYGSGSDYVKLDSEDDDDPHFSAPINLAG